MHELSISSAIVDTALRHAGGRRVTLVELRVGALRQVVPESLGFYFEIVGRDTALRGRRASSQEIVPAWMRCGVCGCEWDPAPEPLAGHERAGAAAADVSLPGVRAGRCRGRARRRARGRVDRGRRRDADGAHAANSS